ncbi:MAG: HD domain-containing protein [Candidatus Sericytochromatia bacterium]|nr:HD domain-containing protein [Candidatus Tanganyikabacteria bacterium]
MLRPPFVLRDVIHSYIDFPDDPLGTLALDVLQTRPFQRLRRLHQLGLGRLIFPNAEHSRFSHSLGAYQLCRRIIAELDRKHLIDHVDPLDRAAVGLAAMLHDLGHGILSHVSEKLWDFHHEAVTDRLIRQHPDLRAVWERHLPPGDDFADRIVQLRAGHDLDPERFFLHDLVSSQVDVDRMDYLLRDAYMAGVRYGGFDLDWIVRHVTVALWHGKLRLAIEEKADDALSQYLLARFHMYKKVYEHRTVRIYDAMLHGLMVRVRALAPAEVAAAGLAWLCEPLADDLASFVARDDYVMWEALKTIAAGAIADPLARRLADDLLQDRRWDGMVCEGEAVAEAVWEGDVFRAPYKRAGFYDLAAEDEALVVGSNGVRALSEDPRVLHLAYAEPAAYIRIRPPHKAHLLV